MGVHMLLRLLCPALLLTPPATAAAAPGAQLTLSMAGAAPMRRLWRTAPSGAADKLDALPTDSALVKALPRWSPRPGGAEQNGTVLFTERISRVRLL
jgi:hypothetical protein